jgi:uncharacterized protein YdhG (YjbR/CyaY superfamily)
MPTTSARRETATSIRAYIAKLPPDVRRAVKQVRATIRASAPGAIEHFSYGIPGFRLEDRPFLWYAGWKTHVALYPITTGISSAHGKQIAAYRKGRGTLQFPLDAGIPLPLIGRIAKTRVREIVKARKSS